MSIDILKIIKESRLCTKTGTDIAAIVEDMTDREERLLLCNFAGDDPNSEIEAYILKEHPDAVIDAITALRNVLKAEAVWLYGTEKHAALWDAISADRKIIGPGSPVLREPAALYYAVDKQEIRCESAELQYESSFPSYGIHGRPTLILDAETLYNLHRLLQGKPLLKAVAFVARNTEIREIPVGTMVQDELEKSLDAEDSLYLIGGQLGHFCDYNGLAIPATYSNQFDSIETINRDDCIVKYVYELLCTSASLSCQKCVMCREGSWQLSAIFRDIISGKGKRSDCELITDISGIIKKSAACGFGKNMVNPVISILPLSQKEIEAHIIAKNCPAGQCEAFSHYSIDPLLCKGCSECIDACEEEAIDGKKGFIHIINVKMCEKCGACMEACPNDAVKSGASFNVPKRLLRVGTFK